MSKTWFVYILRCADDSLYVGITNDVAARVAAHNVGAGARYTRQRRPVRLVFKEAHSDESSARKREAELKGWPRQRKLALIEGSLPSSA